jgi:hypothetical protein
MVGCVAAPTQVMVLIEIKQHSFLRREGERSVPRFHFNAHDGSDHPDLEGVELADVPAARSFAIRYFRDMLHDDPGSLIECGEWKMEVTDEGGLTLFSLHLIGINAPAVDRRDLTISVLPPA